MFRKMLLPLWSFSSILLLAYSFTQVSLGLTLTRFSFWQDIQKTFQYIGYFNRPLSTLFFVGLVLLFSLLYFWTLHLVKHGHIKRETIWRIIFITSGILLFSYNAFSLDIFNYMFDARIVTHYHQSPYEKRALDFPGDVMLSFMHWTHRLLPYGPVWLGLTLVPSLIGSGILLATFYLFKILIIGSFLLSIYFLEKIANIIDKKHSLLSVVLFALNPLIIFEFLVSSHNDSVMILFLLISIYFLLQKKAILSILFFILAFEVKLTVAFLQAAFIFYFLQNRFSRLSTLLLIISVPLFLAFNRTDFVVPDFLKGLPYSSILTSHYYFFIPVVGVILYFLFKKTDIFFIVNHLLLIVPIILASYRTDFQPWYITVMIPFVALYPRYFTVIPMFIISIVLLFQYVPYLYIGDWNQPVPMILQTMSTVTYLLAILGVVIYIITKPFHNRL